MQPNYLSPAQVQKAIKKERRSKFSYLSDEAVVTIVTAEIHQEVQGRGGCPSNDRPEEGKWQQGVDGEEREEDIPRVIALCPTENTNQHLQGLRQPADHRQIPEGESEEEQVTVSAL